MSEPAETLSTLARALRDEASVISPLVRDSDAEPALGLLVAAGPRAARAPGEYALVVESVREGYLLHYDGGRLVDAADPDLALLAGDYLYALGLERLAALGDLEAVRELSDLISLAAGVHDGSRPPARAGHEAAALWLATVTTIAAAGSPGYERAKAELRAAGPQAAAVLWHASADAAAAAGIERQLSEAAEAIEFAAQPVR